MRELTTSTVDRPPLEVAPRLSAAALVGATALALADILTGNHAIALGAVVLIMLHVACCWSRVRMNARLMLLAACAMGAVFLLAGGVPETLSLAASRALYLPALLAVMTLLRVAAQRSRLVGIAAHFVVDQPPSRRYVFLATGAHVFGILLNIGGFQLLLGVALAERDRSAPSSAAAEIQGRRITNAVMRGFGATLLWSPAGVAINLLIPLMPTLVWVDYAPIGLAMVASFVVLGWLFDRLEPRPLRAREPRQHVHAAGALAALLGLLVAIVGAAGLAEAALGLPLRAAMLIVIPSMAVAWVLLTEAGPARASLASLGRDGFRALPDSVSEICLIASTGFLGLVMAEMIPPGAVRAMIDAFALGPGSLACLVAVAITLASLVGISPMIGGTVCAGAVLSSGVAMPEPMLVTACLTGWVGAMMLSPVSATLAIAGGVTGKAAGEIGVRWNGPFTFAYLGLTMAALLVWAASL